MNVFTKNIVDSDKSELRKAIEVADSYLNADDVTYDPATLAVLQEARDKAQMIYDDEEASQTQVNLLCDSDRQCDPGTCHHGW